MEWTFKGDTCTEVPKDMIGFVYMTHYSDGSYYIGKKLCVTQRKKKFGVKKLREMTDKRLKTHEYVTTHLKWRTYEGSSSIKDGYTLVSKEILGWCKTKQAMTFIEAAVQFKNDVLFDEKCLNLNILGKFYPNVLAGESNDKD